MAKLKGCLWFLVTVFLVAAISPLAYAAAGEPDLVVNTVTVQVEVPEGYHLPAKIEDRIEDSVTKVASTVLVGQGVLKVQETRNEISRLFFAVFGKVLQGYEVLDVKIAVSEKTSILLELRPTGPLIEKVDLNLNISGIDDKMIQVIQEETANLSRQIESYLIGLPVSAFNWADDVMLPLLYVLVEEQLPGFVTSIDFNIGSEIKVDVNLLPKGQQIKRVNVEIGTHSLPRSLMYPLELKAEKELEMLEGIPVELLEKHSDLVIETVEDVVQDSMWGKVVYLGSKPKLVIGSEPQLDLEIEWIDFEVSFVGELNIGANAPGPALHIGVGKRLGSNTTVWVKDKIALNQLKSSVSVRVDNYIGAGLTAGVDYELGAGRGHLIFDWRNQRYGVTFTQPSPGEFRDVQIGLNYYPLQFSQVSLIYARQQVWLSLLQSL